MNTVELAKYLRDWVVWKLAEVEREHFPGFVLPDFYAGHTVPFDSYSHLLKTLTLLLSQGVAEINGVDLRQRSLEIVNAVDPEIEAFSSFGFGESVLRLGGLDAVANAEMALQATRSPKVLSGIDKGEGIPPNFKMVMARCMMAEARLSGERPPRLDEFLDTTRALLAQNPSAWINDEVFDGVVHYDMYTPDMYVFAEPLVDELGDAWRTPFATVLNDLNDVVQPGGIIVWGRSSGALALALTVELAAVGAKYGVLDLPTPWFARAEEAANALDPFFPTGIIAAHQNRATQFYRGPARRLQMTFDILDKLAASALDLQEAALSEAAEPVETWREVNRLIPFEEDRNTAVWAHRTRHLPFVMQAIFGWSADYAAAPRSPGLFEHPTGGHPCWLPTFAVGEKAWTPSGLPAVLELNDTTLTMDHEGWNAQGQAATADGAVSGHRHATYKVTGRTITVSEELQIDDPSISQVTISVPELAGRPLDVACSAGTVRRIDTSGLAEWRSYWSELPTLHQIDVPVVDGQATFTWSVTARLRVGSTIRGHWYDQALYGPIEDRVVASLAEQPDDLLLQKLRNLDVLHMGWPEWWGGFSGPSVERTRRWIETVKASGVKVLWTQHNLEPHYFKTDEARQCYQAWAEVTDTVIHHSEWGKAVALERYDYGPQTNHVVIPHGHWSDRHVTHGNVSRAQAEAEFGWESGLIRLAVVGAPREEKKIQDVLDAFADTDRDDMQLIIRISGNESVPDDPRIIVDEDHLDEGQYHRRMKAFDALILPFAPSGMLTTGTAFDVMGAGIAAITSDWGFLDETFDGADIRYGTTAADLQQCLQDLTRPQLEASAKAIAQQQSRFDWEPIAQRTLTVLEELCP